MPATVTHALFWHGRLQQFTYWFLKELLMDEKKILECLLKEWTLSFFYHKISFKEWQETTRSLLFIFILIKLESFL